MHVIVGGEIYQQQARGGISRLYNEILPRMCDLDPALRITLLTDAGRPLRQSLPTHTQIVHCTRPERASGRVSALLWRLEHRIAVGSGRGKLWHSTYFARPDGWQGRRIVTVYDMAYELFEADIYTRPEHAAHRDHKRRAVLAADAVISISRATGEDLQQIYGLDAARIHTIPLGRSAVFQPLADPGPRPTARPFLLYVGKRSARKNFEGLLRAYGCWPRRDEVALVVVGGEWTAPEKTLLAGLGLQDKIHLLTGTDDERLCQLYNQAAAFVYPSLYEGFGIPLLEAMACACPVVASRIPSSLEVAGDIPIYFDLSEPESLIAGFEQALAEGRESARTRAGLDHVRPFTWDRTAAQTLDVYRSLM